MYSKKILILTLLITSSLFADVKGPLKKTYHNKYKKLHGYCKLYATGNRIMEL